MMPATTEELCAWARALLDATVMPDTVPIWADGTRATLQEGQDVMALAAYEARRRRDARRLARSAKARCRAYRLLRLFLSPTQAEQLARCRHFEQAAASGRVYRLIPATGQVDEVERHGKRRYVIRSFCLHPDPWNEVPPADVSLAQLLLLVSDEEEFLRLANATERRSDTLWNGEWQRRLRSARREREAASFATYEGGSNG